MGTPTVSRHVADAVVDCPVTAVALGLYVPNRQLPTEQDLTSMLGASRSFGREALQNAILVGVPVDRHIKISLNLGAEPYSDAVRRIAIRQHQDLVAAMREGRADDAPAIAAVHFTLSGNLIRALVERGEGEPAPANRSTSSCAALCQRSRRCS